MVSVSILVLAWLAVLRARVGVLRMGGPLVGRSLVFDVVADLVLLALLGAVHALLVSVFFFALLFAFFIVSLGAHVLRDWLDRLSMIHVAHLGSIVLGL